MKSKNMKKALDDAEALRARMIARLMMAKRSSVPEMIKKHIDAVLEMLK